MRLQENKKCRGKIKSDLFKKSRAGVLLLSIGAVFISGCSVETFPVTLHERTFQAEQDLKAIFETQEPVTLSFSISEAIARAIKYNIDHRMQMMEIAVAQKASDLSYYDMMPRIAANAGVVYRAAPSLY